MKYNTIGAALLSLLLVGCDNATDKATLPTTPSTESTPSSQPAAPSSQPAAPSSQPAQPGQPAAPSSQPAAPSGQPAPSVSLITAQSVWNGELQNCRQEEMGEDQCLLDNIKKTGPSEALTAAQWLVDRGDPGYVSGYRQEGKVGIATVTYPFRANTNEGTFLVSSDGQPIDIDDQPGGSTYSELWAKFQAEHLNLSAWPPAMLSQSTNTADGQQLTFSYDIRNCHACDKVGSLYISYDFDAVGHFIKSDIVDIKQ